MLDKRSEKVFMIIAKECDGSTFSVIQNSDIFEELPKKMQIDVDGLHSVLNFLANLEFIELKLVDEQVFCMLLLPKGWLYLEQKKNEKKLKKAQSIRASLPLSTIFLIFLICFFATLACMILFETSLVYLFR